MTSDKEQAQPAVEPGESTDDATGPEVEGQLWRMGEVVGGALGRVDSLVPDSREGLSSPEQSLASHGVSWTSDESHDRALAEEIQAARQRRLQRQQ